ncbi:hypothetical protein [Cysteiniphilum halobium]|uniref:hypothetical protein n=1 Tax=Cysteiniphilum halobium TaxID=2219059 RepID=UPI003F83CFAE
MENKLFFGSDTGVEQVPEMQDHVLNSTLAITCGAWTRGQFLNHYDRFTDVFRLGYRFPAKPSIFPVLKK